MLNRFDRITSIFLKLQSRTTLRAEDLAGEFHVSLRTIYRDIRSLEAAGVPILSEVGVGYQLMPGYRLPPVMFTHDEALSFLAAGKLMEHFTSNELAESHQSAMDKVKAILRTDEKWKLENLENRIEVRTLAPEPNSRGPHLPDILKSLGDHSVLKITYYSPGNAQTTERAIEPVGVFFSRFWYMAAWCRLREDYRSFRLDRILKLETNGQKFKAHSYSLNEHLKNFQARENLTKVVLSMDPIVLQFMGDQKYYHGLVEQHREDDREIMTFLCPSLEGMAHWILFFGRYTKILEPEVLRSEVKHLVQTLHAHYFKNPSG